MPRSPQCSTDFFEVIRPLASATLAAVMLASCGSGGPERAGNVKSGEAPGDAVKVDAAYNVFKPTILSLRPGEEVTVEIRNAGERPHDWTIDALNLSTGVMSPSQVFSATFTVPDRDIKYVCTLHAGMEGTIKTGLEPEKNDLASSLR